VRFQFPASPNVSQDESRKSVRILRAAKRVFIRDGNAGFSARGVAKEAKLSLGAVQHFYRTKHALLAATLEHVVNEYEGAYEKLFDSVPDSHRARLLGVIDYLVKDVWDPETRRFFLALWALSCNNAFAAELVDEMYSFHVRRLETFIAAAEPRLKAAERREIAVQIAAMLEGLMLFTGSGAKPLLPRKRMTQAVKRTAMKLMTQPTQGARP
jgi:AcrR family transcriptional regulator